MTSELYNPLLITTHHGTTSQSLRALPLWNIMQPTFQDHFSVPHSNVNKNTCNPSM